MNSIKRQVNTMTHIQEKLKKKEKRWFRILLVLSFLFCIAYFHFIPQAYQFTLECSRTGNQCVVTENHIFDNNEPDKRTFLLSEVEDIRLHTNDMQQKRIYVYVNSEPIPIDQVWTTEHIANQTAVVKAFQQFLKSDSQGIFSYRSERTSDFKNSAWILGIFFCLMLIVTGIYGYHRQKRTEIEKKEITNETNK